MAIESVCCPVSRELVTRVTNFEGHVERLICPDYEIDGICRLMKTAREGGPLTQFLERHSEHTLSSRDTHCVLQSA